MALAGFLNDFYFPKGLFNVFDVFIIAGILIILIVNIAAVDAIGLIQCEIQDRFILCPCIEATAG
jgi:hypothetical protein